VGADPHFLAEHVEKPRGIEARSKARPQREDSLEIKVLGQRCRRTTNRRRLNSIFPVAGNDEALSTVMPYLPWTSARGTCPIGRRYARNQVPGPAIWGRQTEERSISWRSRRAVSSACVFSHTCRDRSSQPHQTSIAPKIADALRPGPRFFTKDSTRRDWPLPAGAQYHLRRKGTGSACRNVPAMRRDPSMLPSCHG
jgi:hypothetical protein